MKLNFLATTVALCTLGMTRCTKEMEEAEAPVGKRVLMTMQAAESQTRADYTEDGEFSWRKGDEMSVVVYGVTGNEDCNLVTQVEGKSVPFNGSVTPWADGAKNIYAIYPYGYRRITNGDKVDAATVRLDCFLQYDAGSKAISHSFMVGAGTATVSPDGTISASASMKQVMSFLRLDIKDAPGKVTGVALILSEGGEFIRSATVRLSDATISEEFDKTTSWFLDVINSKNEPTVSIPVALFPVNLTGKNIDIEVTFDVDGTPVTKTISKTGTDFKRNVHYVLPFDVKDKFIEVNGIKVATGNLIADGANGAKIGAGTDGGLYFLFGSLIGWAGGATGDGTGVPAGDTPGYEFNGTGTVVPSGKSVPSTWGDPDRWTGKTGDVPAEFDPCTHYLGSPWRLPTGNEYFTLFGTSTSLSNGWSWIDSPASATHTSGLTFPASGIRNAYVGGSLNNVGTNGCYWSASCTARKGYVAFFNNSYLNPGYGYDRANGVPVRCVQ